MNDTLIYFRISWRGVGAIFPANKVFIWEMNDCCSWTEHKTGEHFRDYRISSIHAWNCKQRTSIVKNGDLMYQFQHFHAVKGFYAFIWAGKRDNDFRWTAHKWQFISPGIPFIIKEIYCFALMIHSIEAWKYQQTDIKKINRLN